MDKQKIVKFVVLRNIFNFAFMMEMKTYLRYLGESGLTVSDHIEYVKKESKSRIEHGRGMEHTVLDVDNRCPKCNRPMTLHPVNTDDTDQTGDDSQYVWQCRNVNCMEQVYIKEI